jgi:hypothetical protein
MENSQVLKRNKRGTEYIEAINGEVIAKRCTACGEIKELEHFNQLKGGLADKQSKCKQCLSEYLKKYHKENPSYRMKQYEINKEKYGEYKKKYYEKNKESYRERNKKFLEENPDYHKNYYEENKRKYRERILSK